MYVWIVTTVWSDGVSTCNTIDNEEQAIAFLKSALRCDCVNISMTKVNKDNNH